MEECQRHPFRVRAGLLLPDTGCHGGTDIFAKDHIAFPWIANENVNLLRGGRSPAVERG